MCFIGSYWCGISGDLLLVGSGGSGCDVISCVLFIDRLMVCSMYLVNIVLGLLVVESSRGVCIVESRLLK